jgi:SWIM zinc finger
VNKKNPGRVEPTEGWHHTLTAKAVRMRLVAAFSVRRSAEKRKTTMDAREQRGLEIAARFKVVRRERDWSVPSQTGEGKYTVSGVDVDAPRCTCPDFEERQQACKHVFAVKIVIQREFEFDGETITERETVSITKTVRKTYPQNWPAYNAAQTNEKDRFMVLLRDLCSGLPEPEQKRGRPRLSLWDSVFAAVLKVYGTASARRSMSDLREAQERGHIAKVPCHNSVLNALENPDLGPLLCTMIAESARPLKAVEIDFAVDSSGFTTCTYESWFDHKYGAPSPALVGEGAHHVRGQDKRGHRYRDPR